MTSKSFINYLWMTYGQWHYLYPLCLNSLSLYAKRKYLEIFYSLSLYLLVYYFTKVFIYVSTSTSSSWHRTRVSRCYYSQIISPLISSYRSSLHHRFCSRLLFNPLTERIFVITSTTTNYYYYSSFYGGSYSLTFCWYTDTVSLVLTRDVVVFRTLPPSFT